MIGAAPGRRCTICHHPQRADIDRALMAGASHRTVADQYRVAKTSVQRHMATHVPPPAMAAAVAQASAIERHHGTTLAQDAAALRDKALTLLEQAEGAGDLRTALIGVREVARCIELLAKLAGEIDDRATINVLVAPAFVSVRTAIVTALTPFPDARAAVLRTLEALA